MIVVSFRELLGQLQKVIDADKEKTTSLLKQVIDVLDLLFKFIVQSAILYAK